MSTIPIQNLIVDNDTDIGLTSDLINGTYKSSSLTDLSNNVYSQITDLSSNVYTELNSKQPTLTPLTNLVGMGNNISEINYNNITLNKPTNFQSDWNSTIINKPNLTVYAIKSNVDSSLNTINSTLATKENALTAVTPLKKDVSNNITIDLSAYVLKTSFNNIIDAQNQVLSTKEELLTFNTPLTRTSNSISVNLSNYALSNSLNASNITSGTLSIARGGISVTTLTANQILIGNC